LTPCELLLQHHISGAPVVDAKGKYLGVFSEKCSMHVLLDAAYEQLPVHDVRSFMDVEAQTIAPETHLLSIAQVFLLTPLSPVACAGGRETRRPRDPSRRDEVLDAADRRGAERFAGNDADLLQCDVCARRSAASVG
jgi:CBS domain-containing protein